MVPKGLKRKIIGLFNKVLESEKKKIYQIDTK